MPKRCLVRIKNYGRPSGRGPQPPMITTNLLRGEETGRTTNKLTAIKSLVVGTAKLRGLHPGADTEPKAHEVPLRPTNIRQLKQRGRPNNKKDQTNRPSSRYNQIGRPNSLNDKTDGAVHLNNLIIQPDPQEIRMIKWHVWRKNCEK